MGTFKEECNIFENGLYIFIILYSFIQSNSIVSEHESLVHRYLLPKKLFYPRTATAKANI